MIVKEGQHFCEGCSCFVEEASSRPRCLVYFPEGQKLRIRLGHCPAATIPKAEEGNRYGKWADWREDKPKPIKSKKRMGQQKGGTHA